MWHARFSPSHGARPASEPLKPRGGPGRDRRLKMPLPERPPPTEEPEGPSPGEGAPRALNEGAAGTNLPRA
ncbi:hypothetical protein GCM10018952_04000 [Streptosporangium vulgare]